MDKIELLFDRPAADPQIRGALQARILFHNLQAAYTSTLAPGLSQETSLQLGIQELRTEIGPEYFFELAVNRVSLRHGWSWDVSSWLGLRAGMDVRLEDVAISLNSPQQPKEGESGAPSSAGSAIAVTKDSLLYSPGAFVEVRLQPTAKLLVLPSLRADWYGLIEEWGIDPRLAVRYTLLPRTTLAAGVGLYSQPPAPDEGDPDTGNPALLPERSLQTSLGVEQGLGEALELVLTGFYKRLDRLVVRNRAAATDPTAPRFLDSGEGRIYGVEAQLKGQVGPSLTGWIAYTYQRSFRTDRPGEEERLFDFDQPHILTLLGSYALGRGWTAGARVRFVSGNPDTPVVSALWDAGLDVWVPVYGETNSERLEAFWQIDLRVDKTWTFDRWKLAAYLDVQNVTNHGNQEGWSYSFDYRERQALTGLPILPILGVKGEW